MKLNIAFASVVLADRTRLPDDQSRTVESSGACYLRPESDQCYWGGQDDNFRGCTQEQADNG